MYVAAPTKARFKPMLFLELQEIKFFLTLVKTNLVLTHAVPGEQYEQKSS